MSSSSRRPQKRKAAASSRLLFRLLSTAAVVFLVTGISVFFSSRIGGPAEQEQAGHPDPTDAPNSLLVSQNDSPELTPTPAVFAPFGAQYGYGGEDLIPLSTALADEEIPLFTPDPTPSPTPLPTATPVTTLRKGDNNKNVQAMQEKLISLGYLDGNADDVFGSKTEDAVIMFQAVNHLTADGLAGAKTLSLLYSSDALSADNIPKTDFLILVNRKLPLDQGYVPSDLVEIERVLPSDVVKVKYSGTKANRTAVEALGTLLRAAEAQGIGNWQISSAYRTYKEQQKLVDNSVATYMKNNPDWSKKQALSATYNTVAPAGTSEHQTGLAFDITVPGVSFTGTEQQKWLHAHCHEYGFVIRFTKDKQSITGFIAESWHIRYVGTEAADTMTRNNWCLEEYVENVLR